MSGARLWTGFSFSGTLATYFPIARYLFVYSISQLVKLIKIYWLPTLCQASVGDTTAWTLCYSCDIIPKQREPTQPCQAPDSENHHCLESYFAPNWTSWILIPYQVYYIFLDTITWKSGHPTSDSSIARWVPSNSGFFSYRHLPFAKVLADFSVSLVGFWPSQHL